MNFIKKYILLILPILLIVFDVGYILNLVKSFSYLNHIRDNVELVQKEIWINYNITIWLIIVNSIYISILTIKSYRKLKK